MTQEEIVLKYSTGMKQAVLKRVIPPANESVAAVSRETGIATQTIYYWKKQASEGTLDMEGSEVKPSQRGKGEKLNLLLESRGVSSDQFGEWLRSHGLHSEHLPLWEQELRDTVSDKDKEKREEMHKLKEENKKLKKELDRKDKALSETAALLALKKKAESIWGDKEED